MSYKVMTFSLAIFCILHNCPISTEHKRLKRSGADVHDSSYTFLRTHKLTIKMSAPSYDATGTPAVPNHTALKQALLFCMLRYGLSGEVGHRGGLEEQGPTVVFHQSEFHRFSTQMQRTLPQTYLKSCHCVYLFKHRNIYSMLLHC
jgi:hypothetical protein